MHIAVHQGAQPLGIGHAAGKDDGVYLKMQHGRQGGDVLGQLIGQRLKDQLLRRIVLRKGQAIFSTVRKSRVFR